MFNLIDMYGVTLFIFLLFRGFAAFGWLRQAKRVRCSRELILFLEVLNYEI